MKPMGKGHGGSVFAGLLGLRSKWELRLALGFQAHGSIGSRGLGAGPAEASGPWHDIIKALG